MRFLLSFILIMSPFWAISQGDCSQNEILNSGFESGGTGWGVLVPSPSNIFNPSQPEITTDAFEGNNAAVGCGPESVIAYTTPFQNEGGRTYVVSACAKIEGSPAKVGFGAVYITLTGSLTGFDTVSVSSNEYVCYSKTFVPPANQFFGIGFALEGDSDQDKIIIDNFCVEIFDSCEVGADCDDQNPNTVNDKINGQCICKGTTCAGIQADAGVDQSILPGESAILTASGADNVIWNTGDETATITVSPNETTTYTACVYDDINCQDCDDVIVNLVQTYDIGNCVWQDDNGDGCKDPDEPGLNNVGLELYDATFDVMLRTAFTSEVNGEDGIYQFDNWLPGNYYIKIKDLPDSYTITDSSACNEDRDSDFDPITGQTEEFTVSGNTLNVDLGLRLKPLSVGIVGFDVKSRTNHNLVDWHVIPEESVDHYIIARKINDAADFRTIAVISPNQANYYSIADEDIILAGTYYYRVTTYKDGQENHSEIISIEVAAPNTAWDVQLVPNITHTGQIMLNIHSPLNASKATYSVMGINSVILAIQDIKLTGPITKTDIDISSLSAGLYYVMVESEGFIQTKRFVKY